MQQFNNSPFKIAAEFTLISFGSKALNHLYNRSDLWRLEPFAAATLYTDDAAVLGHPYTIGASSAYSPIHFYSIFFCIEMIILLYCTAFIYNVYS